MPIITNGEQAREILNGIMERGTAIPCFCTESVYTTEAIFSGAGAYKKQHNIEKNLPLIHILYCQLRGPAAIEELYGTAGSEGRNNGSQI